MKYVVTGGAGNISAPLTEQLLKAGHEVTVIGRSAANLQSLVAAGAKAAVGTIEDVEFLKQAFAGAEVAYIMIPPNFAIENWRHFQNEVGRNFVEAVAANNISKVVLLSSIGAHMGNGAGPVDGLADLEDLFKKKAGINIKALRPSYFMLNLLGMIPMIKGNNILGGNFGAGDNKLVLVHPKDIAAAAAEELLAPDFTGFSVRYIAGDEKTGTEIASFFSKALNIPGLPWVEFTDEQSYEGMRGAGLSETIAAGYSTMGKALREGKMQEHYYANKPALSNTKLEDFAGEVLAVYNAS